jgi:nucleoside-diphosphate-sugar epimerase
MEKVLVTGATGFVGGALCSVLGKNGIVFVPVIRKRLDLFPNAAIVPDINPTTDWSGVLSGVDTVIHLAARVHMPDNISPLELQAYSIANADSTIALARQCALAAVRRFIFLSSVKVNGETTRIHPFRADDVPNPIDPYGVSKLEAERGLTDIAATTGMELVIIRPPLVYGPNVKANFLQLMTLIKRGIPLPFGNLENRRSLVFIGNLIDLIIRCGNDPRAAGHTFMVSDHYDVSTTQLIQAIASAMHKPSMLFSMPRSVLTLAAAVSGKRTIADRLLGSLQVDIDPTMNSLDWAPPHTFEYGIEATVRSFLRG